MQRVCFWWSLTLPQVRTLIHFITLHHTASPLHHTASHSITLHHPCIKLHHTASPLHHTPSQCITLHHTASHCITLHIASHCITLHHTASPCITLHHPASPCITPASHCITPASPLHHMATALLRHWVWTICREFHLHLHCVRPCWSLTPLQVYAFTRALFFWVKQSVLTSLFVHVNLI